MQSANELIVISSTSFVNETISAHGRAATLYTVYMLVSIVERAGYKAPQERQTTILDLGCGKCEEGIVHLGTVHLGTVVLAQ